LAESVGIVHHGGEEIDSLNEGCVRAELVNAGVIGMVEADENIWVILPGELLQHGVQNRGTQLGGAAAGFDSGSQADRRNFRHAAIVKEGKAPRILRIVTDQSRKEFWSIRENPRKSVAALLKFLLGHNFCDLQSGVSLIPVGADVLEGEAELLALVGSQRRSCKVHRIEVRAGSLQNVERYVF
jgi:hypothetical protein